MKLIFLTIPFFVFVNGLALQVHAQGTGDFHIKKNDFKTLFNDVRVGQPSITPWAATYWPYGLQGTSAKVENGEFTKSDRRGNSPMEAFDKIANNKGKNSATEWEKITHTCDKLTGEDKKGCESWWGHCNGWAAAAIKEMEPRKPFTVRGVELSVADAKGIFSEIWLSTNSLGAGETDKSAEIKDGLKPNGWIDDTETDEYIQFWDTTPRAFFLILTNYVGVNQMGFVIDRHAGHEVWNQPLVGYRILPIDAKQIRPEERNGRTVWALPLAVKIYWANDLGTPPGAITEAFDIRQHTKDNAFIEESLPTTSDGGIAYEGRLLEFTLFFDREVKISADGLRIETAGFMVGDGVWKMQITPRSYNENQLSESHPDFVWLPTNALVDDSGYGNPYMNTKITGLIQKANNAAQSQKSAPMETLSEKEIPNTLVSYRVSFKANAFANLRQITTETVRNRLVRLMARTGVKAAIDRTNIEIDSTQIRMNLVFPEGIGTSELQALFASANMPVVALEKL